MKTETATTAPAPVPAHAPGLYRLVEEYLDTLVAIEEAEGEVTDAMAEKLAILEPDLERRAEIIAAVCRTLTEEAEACDRFAQLYTKKAKVKKTQAKAEKKRLHEAMTALGIKKIKAPTVSVRIQASAPSLELLVAQAELPDEWVETQRVPRTADLKAALKAGETPTYTNADGEVLPIAKLASSTHIRFH